MSQHRSLTLIPFLAFLTLLIQSAQAVKGVDQNCVLKCSDWSVVLGHCRAEYNQVYQQYNLTYMNDFLGCLCTGSTSRGELGNATIGESAGTCLACRTTPGIIKNNLSTFLTLCAVQHANGTAGNATLFAPIGYSTSNDESQNGAQSGDARAVARFFGWIWVLGLPGLVVVVVAIVDWAMTL
ncbi:hypothetical protein IAU60_003890 [Kwoniella sp. DSM 27419]